MTVTPTTIVCRLASTAGGMRRILKKKGTVADYIQKAVETGVYRSQEEIRACIRDRRETDDLASVMRRFRQDVVRGSNIHDYPTEYLILRQNPPVPETPRTPIKLLRKLRQQEKDLRHNKNTVEDLVYKYMNRFEQKSRNSGTLNEGGTKNSDTMSSDDYYERLLGVQGSKSKGNVRYTGTKHILTNQSATVQRAYDAAIYYYQLQRDSGNTISDFECMKQVDELLSSQLNKEQTTTRQQLTKIVNTSTKQQQKPSASKSSKGTKDKGKKGAAATTIAKDLEMNPSVVKAMMIWSDRLQTIPYKEWTVGASTALDHWIARQVLQVSEETWEMCLEGSSSEPHYLAIGRDIIATREALFPETIIGSRDDIAEFRTPQLGEQDDFDDDRELQNSRNAVNSEIDDLLASLSGLGSTSSRRDNESKKTEEVDTVLTKHDVDHTTAVDKLVEELQDWRRKVHLTEPKQPYELWSIKTQAEFDAWLKQYVDTVLLSESATVTSKQIDYERTREALLSQPPVDRDESDAFWGSLSEPQLALELVKRLKSQGGKAIPANVGSVLAISKVWDELDETEQVERLLNLGAVRPLLDEYTSLSDRSKFLKRYGYHLLQNIQLEHLVADPDGPITKDDLPADIVKSFNIQPEDRFTLQFQPYNAITNDGSDNTDSGSQGKLVLSAEEKSRLLYKAWNAHKAGRARYEEKMFQTGRLGVRYNDPIPNEDDDDDDEN